MKKLIALVFAVAALAAGTLASTASANESWHSCSGLSTAYYASGGANYDPGQAWHACD